MSQLNLKEICPCCHGHGVLVRKNEDGLTDYRKCPICGGLGWVKSDLARLIEFILWIVLFGLIFALLAFFA